MLQCHPHLPVVATSGIESVVKLWAPLGRAEQLDATLPVQRNQERTMTGPRLLRGINPQFLQVLFLCRVCSRFRVCVDSRSCLLEGRHRTGLFAQMVISLPFAC